MGGRSIENRIKKLQDIETQFVSGKVENHHREPL